MKPKRLGLFALAATGGVGSATDSGVGAVSSGATAAAEWAAHSGPLRSSSAAATASFISALWRSAAAARISAAAASAFGGGGGPATAACAVGGVYAGAAPKERKFSATAPAIEFSILPLPTRVVAHDAASRSWKRVDAQLPP